MNYTLQQIFGAENAPINCPFFFKIGACRSGETCSRVHSKPGVSQTLLLIGLYKRPVEDLADGSDHGEVLHFERFYEQLFLELSQYGEIEHLHVVDNLAQHMLGNVYCKYKRAESATLARNSLLGRDYGGHPIVAELSPVTDFREASCRLFEQAMCSRGGDCNFLHIKVVNAELRRKLWGT